MSSATVSSRNQKKHSTGESIDRRDFLVIIVAGFATVEPTDRDRYVAEFRDLVRRARQAPGCQDVAISADSVDPGRVNNFELWTSQEHLDAWRAVASPPETGIEFSAVQMQEYEIARAKDPFS